jgi:hypothetical protein
MVMVDVVVVVFLFVLLALVFVVDADAAAADPEDAATVCAKDATEGPPLEAAWSSMVLFVSVYCSCLCE